MCWIFSLFVFFFFFARSKSNESSLIWWHQIKHLGLSITFDLKGHSFFCLVHFSTWFSISLCCIDDHDHLSCRTLMDLWIALSHIIATIFSLSESESDCALVGCQVIGVFNEIALVASNVWYAMLALDLIKAIRNPFRWASIKNRQHICTSLWRDI